MRRLLASVSDRDIGIFGAILGGFGLMLSIYFYFAAVAERRPVFLLDDTARAVIASKQEMADSAIVVTRRDGKAVERDINIAKFYFWNDGALAIKQDEILKPVRLYVEGGEILAHKLTRVSRGVVEPKLTQSAPDSIVLSARILEKDDGFAGHIIYEGPRTAKIKLDGVIQGVGEIEFCSCLVPKKPWFLLLSGAGYIALLCVLMFDLARRWKRRATEDRKRLASLAGATVLAAVLTFGGLYRLHTFSKISAEPPTNLLSPATLLPQ
jgi:hypothetical protein